MNAKNFNKLTIIEKEVKKAKLSKYRIKDLVNWHFDFTYKLNLDINGVTALTCMEGRQVTIRPIFICGTLEK